MLTWCVRIPTISFVLKKKNFHQRTRHEILCKAYFEKQGCSVWHYIKKNCLLGTAPLWLAFRWGNVGPKGWKRSEISVVSWPWLYFVFDIYFKSGCPKTDVYWLHSVRVVLVSSWRVGHIHTLRVATFEYITFFYIRHWAVSLQHWGDSVPCSRALSFV